MLKMIVYRGIPYVSIGIENMRETNRSKINKVFVVFGIPIAIKTFIVSKRIYRSFIYDAIKKHHEMFIEEEHLQLYREVVYAENNRGKFFVGTPLDAYRMVGYENFMNFDTTRTDGVARVAKKIGKNEWCGFSGEIIKCFKKGDYIFDDGKTNSNEYGSRLIMTEYDMIDSASRFAKMFS